MSASYLVSAGTMEMIQKEQRMDQEEVSQYRDGDRSQRMFLWWRQVRNFLNT